MRPPAGHRRLSSQPLFWVQPRSCTPPHLVVLPGQGGWFGVRTVRGFLSGDQRSGEVAAVQGRVVVAVWEEASQCASMARLQARSVIRRSTGRLYPMIVWNEVEVDRLLFAQRGSARFGTPDEDDIGQLTGITRSLRTLPIGDMVLATHARGSAVLRIDRSHRLR